MEISSKPLSIDVPCPANNARMITKGDANADLISVRHFSRLMRKADQEVYLFRGQDRKEGARVVSTSRCRDRAHRAKVQGLIPCRALFADHKHSLLSLLLFETRVTFAQANQQSEYNLCMASGRYANWQLWPNSAAVSTPGQSHEVIDQITKHPYSN